MFDTWCANSINYGTIGLGKNISHWHCIQEKSTSRYCNEILESFIYETPYHFCLYKHQDRFDKEAFNVKRWGNVSVKSETSLVYRESS